MSPVDGAGRKLFCFVTPDGLESPTLHVRPGDELNIRLRNLVVATPRDKAPAMSMTYRFIILIGPSACYLRFGCGSDRALPHPIG